ncbi:MAG: calcium/sodium antiporter [Candidatus Marinimicrobia bacterium]|nr:calcium/sodium antiporter [Candidatus Neomarinimicrobiota bacterium]
MCLYFGAKSLVDGSSAVALKFGVQKMIVGMTVVALGTSMPEFVVSLFGVLKESDSVSVGNIVGSNVANLLLVLGASALFQPLCADKRAFKLDLPFVMIVIAFFIAFCFNGVLSRIEGIFLLTLFIAYMIFLSKNKRVEDYKKEVNTSDREHLLKNAFLTILGIGGLVLGGNLTVKGGIMLAHVLGLSELTIGLSVIAVGTSLPELFTSLVAAVKSEHDISVGNVIGSNLFNTAFVLGVVPIISSITIDSRVISFENWFMAGAHILLLLVLLTRKRIDRKAGVLFLLLYAFFIVNLRLQFI